MFRISCWIDRYTKGEASGTVVKRPSGRSPLKVAAGALMIADFAHIHGEPISRSHKLSFPFQENQ